MADWKLVPIATTAEMRAACRAARAAKMDSDGVWAAMLKAAPSCWSVDALNADDIVTLRARSASLEALRDAAERVVTCYYDDNSLGHIAIDELDALLKGMSRG